MEREGLPRLTVEVTKQEYIAAAMIAARRTGALRRISVVILIVFGLLTAGICALLWAAPPFSTVICLVAFLACALLPLVFCVWEPAGVRKRAAVDFETYDRLMGKAEWQLSPDNILTKTPFLTFTDQYALLPECIETPALLVFIRDKEHMLVLPRRCIPADRTEEVLAFIRLTFTRKYRIMRNWFA